MNQRTIAASLCRLFLLSFCVFTVSQAYAQADSMPPANITAAQDWAQMLSQLNLTLPTLLLKKMTRTGTLRQYRGRQTGKGIIPIFMASSSPVLPGVCGPSIQAILTLMDTRRILYNSD